MKKHLLKGNFLPLSSNFWLYVLIIACLILKIQFSGQSYQVPELAAILIFYKSIHDEMNLNIYFLIIYSIFQDVFQDLPLGTMLLGYFVFIKLLEANRRYIFDHGPMAHLVGFGLAFACILLIKAIIFTSTYGLNQISMSYYCLELIYMLAYYPLLHSFMNKVTQTYRNE